MRTRRCRLPGLAALLLLAALPAAAATEKKVIIDTDPGIDDAMAILLALNSPELDVQALTVVPGNVPLRQGTENALRLVSLAGRCDLPVAAGADRPLVQQLTTAEFWHGQNGLADVNLPAPQCKLDPRFAPDLIIELVHRFPNEITLVPVGPLTNIALATRKDPSIVPLVKEVILMGGSISGGNVTAAAEANIYGDPEAAKIVFSAGWRITMVGLDVGNKALVRRADLARLSSGPQSEFARAALGYILDRSEEFGFPGTAVYDALAVAVTIDRSLVTAQPMRVEIETRGEHTRGETVAYRYNLVDQVEWRDGRNMVVGILRVRPNAEVCVEVDAARFVQLLLSRLSGR
ncbi:MAG TPA: nucleoside hydrolase [Candidatus Xenobia bacterium]|nr:nucleoside hydrolase [Candidatus Xenobia bacterium]